MHEKLVWVVTSGEENMEDGEDGLEKDSSSVCLELFLFKS